MSLLSHTDVVAERALRRKSSDNKKERRSALFCLLAKIEILGFFGFLFAIQATKLGENNIEFCFDGLETFVVCATGLFAGEAWAIETVVSKAALFAEGRAVAAEAVIATFALFETVVAKHRLFTVWTERNLAVVAAFIAGCVEHFAFFTVVAVEARLESATKATTCATKAAARAATKT